MWKIAIAVMLLATSTFGAVSLTMAPADGRIVVDPVTLQGTLTLGLDITGADKVNGFSLGALAPLNAVQVIAISYPGSKIKDPNVPTAAGTILDDQGLVDFGATAPAGAANYELAGHTDVITLTLKVLPGVPIGPNTPVDVQWYMFPTVNDGAASLDPVTTSLVTPEPASMLLLAAGAAFFARRRRA